MNKVDFDRLVMFIIEELKTGPKKSFLVSNLNDKIFVEQYGDNDVCIVLKKNIFVDKPDTGTKKFDSTAYKLSNESYTKQVVKRAIEKWKQTMEGKVDRVV